MQPGLAVTLRINSYGAVLSFSASSYCLKGLQTSAWSSSRLTLAFPGDDPVGVMADFLVVEEVVWWVEELELDPAKP